MKSTSQLHFEEVTPSNRTEIEKLEIFSEQSGFIESVSACLQEADALDLWRPVGIYDGSTLIGFAMYGFCLLYTSRLFKVASSLSLSRWWSPMDGSSRI